VVYFLRCYHIIAKTCLSFNDMLLSHYIGLLSQYGHLRFKPINLGSGFLAL